MAPFGEITHYFYRIEYQTRGTQHVHMLLWAKDAPKSDADENTIVRYIDDHVTARMPDEASEPELHRLVNRHQLHWEKHSKTCSREVRYRGKRSKICRFEFPRPAVDKTTINRNCSMLRGVPGAKTKFYSLNRRAGIEQMVNDYNPLILLSWRANIDVQYLSADMLDIVNYITGYTTKHETSKEAAELRKRLSGYTSTTDMMSVFLDLLKKRETGKTFYFDY